MPITSEQYKKRADETIAQYNQRIASLRAAPTSVEEETSTGTLSSLGGGASETAGSGAETAGGTLTTTDMNNLSQALKAALSEAGQTVAKQRMTAMSGMVEGGAAPNVINMAIGLAQSGLRQTQADVFGDILTTYKENIAMKQREQEQINNLRLQFGTAIPKSVDSLSEALDYVTPLVDEERRLEIAGLKKSLEDVKTEETLTDDDWYKLIKNEQARISDIDNSTQQTRVFQMFADEIPDPDNEEWVKKWLKKGKEEDPNWTPDEVREDFRALGVSENILSKILKTETTTVPEVIVPSETAQSTTAMFTPSREIEKSRFLTEEEKKEKEGEEGSTPLFQPFDFNSTF
jgi:hypothetical protein